jgi:hypothetical protein
VLPEWGSYGEMGSFPFESARDFSALHWNFVKPVWKDD